MKREDIHRILSIKESYQLADRLIEILKDSAKRVAMFDEFLQIESSLTFDWFTEYFQEEQGDRKNLKQDFTPDSVCDLVAKLTKKNKVADICSGTGGLTLKQWNCGAKEFFCVEYSERAIPILLFNLAIRNTNATVIHGDVLTQEVFHVYSLQQGEKYSEIEEISEAGIKEEKFQTIITNPPYSIAWDGDKNRIKEERFAEFGIAPKTKADYAFLLDCLYRLEDGGELVAILPHGVLFRGQSEGEIRKKLLEKNYIDTVIGLPDKLFMNTGIPVCVMIFKKNREKKDILFIEASKEFTKSKPINKMEEKHIERIIGAVNLRMTIDKFANVVHFEEVEKNGFNLNIPRYVDIFDEEPLKETLSESLSNLAKLQKEILDVEKELFQMSSQLVARTPELKKELEVSNQKFKELIKTNERRVEQLALYST